MSRKSLIFTLLMSLVSLCVPIRIAALEASKSDFGTIVSTDMARGRNALCALRDRYGFLWVGTHAGLACYDGNGSAIYPSSADLHPATEGMPVTAIYENGDDIWLGGTAGISVFNRRSNTVLPLSSATAQGAKIASPVRRIMNVGGGFVWILTLGQGLFIYNTADDSLTQNTAHGDFYSDIALGRDGRIYVVSLDGDLQIFDPAGGFITAHPLPGGSNDRQGLRIVCTDGGEILIASGSAIYNFDLTTQEVTLETTNPVDYNLNSLLSDESGNLVMATDSGLIVYDRLRHTFGLPGGETTSAFPAGKISHISYDMDSSMIIVSPEAGISHLLHRSSAFHQDSADNMVDEGSKISSTDGSRFVKVYVQSISFPELSDSDSERSRLGLDIPLYTRDEIVIPYSDNTFTLTLAASRGADMEPVRYDYMLHGVDKHWVKNADSQVTYADLRPGRYTFMVRPASGFDTEIRKLGITVSPPWYRTWMALTVFAVVGVVLAVFVVIMLRRRMNVLYQSRLEALKIQKEHEAFEAKMRFFVNLVHEIRTPLTLISIPLEQMAANMEKNSQDAEENKKHIASMRRNVNYLLGITNQLLDFRKAEEGKEVKLLLGEHNIKNLLTDICGRFEHPMAALGKRISLVMPQGNVSAKIDSDKTDRVIMNIIGNAVKYSRSRVDVTLREPVDGTVSISVADDGPGIDPAERDHIFDTYYQIGGDNVAANLGTGLGLAYAKLIANAHGGEIKVENNAGGGATFTLSFPVDNGEVAENTAGEEVPQFKYSEVVDGVKYVTVLLVDDNRELLASVADGLGKHYNVLTADSGEEALAELNRRNDVDVIVSDFMMPGMSGAELCRTVKSDSRFSHLPFIILTAKTDSDAKVEGMECGADVYMEKPFSIKQLSLQISNMLHTRELFQAHMSATKPDSEQVSNEVADPEEPTMNRLDAEFISTLNAYLSENISEEDFSIDTMAKQMNMSRSSFYRKLKAVTGMTPVDYLKNYRLNYSAKLLLDGVRVTEVAVLAGFTSSSYFAKCFRAHFGMIPKEYVAAHSSKSG